MTSQLDTSLFVVLFFRFFVFLFDNKFICCEPYTLGLCHALLGPLKEEIAGVQQLPGGTVSCTQGNGHSAWNSGG